jgi:hypothetical protein
LVSYLRVEAALQNNDLTLGASDIKPARPQFIVFAEVIGIRNRDIRHAF